jgi:hypothetical protein
MKVPNPEQTACLLSLVLYFFLDQIIFLSYRLPHLPFDQLPPLADYDYCKNLKAKAFPVSVSLRPPNTSSCGASIWIHSLAEKNGTFFGISLSFIAANFPSLSSRNWLCCSQSSAHRLQ